MKIFKSLGFLAIALLGLLPGSDLKASHFSSGEIYYRWAPIPTDSSRYEVFVNWYRNNGGANITQTTQNVCITSSCFGNVNGVLNRLMPPAGQASPGDNNGGWIVPGLDECANASDPSYKDLSVHKFSGFVSLPGQCGDFKFTANAVCCRDGSTNLAASPNMYLEAKLNNTLGESSSPEIQAPAGKAFCLTQPGAKPFEFIQAAIDLDNDSIRYRFGHPQQGVNCGPGTNIPFSAGFTVNSPFPSSTGIVIDQQTGIFRFSPSQQGSYVVKIVVEDWRFDPVTLQWLNIGETVREIQVPVTANCNPTSSSGPRVSITAASNNAQLQNFTQADIDSMKTQYNMAYFFGEDSITNGVATVHQIPVFQGYNCFDSLVSIEFNNNVRCASATPTDFRLIGPDGVARPIVEVETNCQFLVSRNLDLVLNQPLDVDGNYILQIRRGNDGTTLLNECGIELPEFYTFIIPVSGCPAPTYQLDGLTVERDLDVRLDWSGNAALSDPSIIATFNSWNIYRADSGVRPMSLVKVIDDPNARFFVDSFAPNGFYVDNYVYDYQVMLVYNGKGRELTRFCSNMRLRMDSAKSTNEANQANTLALYWNHYNCMPPASRTYDVYRGKLDTSNLRVNWSFLSNTSDTSITVNVPKADSLNEGSYAIRVVARNPNGSGARTDSSESNWFYYGISYFPPPPPPPDLGPVLVPNIITPNGDMINDRFYIEKPLNSDKQYEKIVLSIFNRNGQRVFHDENFQDRNTQADGWDGTSNSGQKLTDGVYFYILELANPATGQNESMQGNLTINAGIN